MKTGLAFSLAFKKGQCHETQKAVLGDPDPEPDPEDLHVFGLPDPDLLDGGMDPDPTPDPSFFS
jgi:hypothetical protein